MSGKFHVGVSWVHLDGLKGKREQYNGMKLGIWEVSSNRATPKSWNFHGMFMEFSIRNHPFLGYPHLWEPLYLNGLLFCWENLEEMMVLTIKYRGFWWKLSHPVLYIIYITKLRYRTGIYQLDHHSNHWGISVYHQIHRDWNDDEEWSRWWLSLVCWYKVIGISTRMGMVQNYSKPMNLPCD